MECHCDDTLSPQPTLLSLVGRSECFGFHTLLQTIRMDLLTTVGCVFLILYSHVLTLLFVSCDVASVSQSHSVIAMLYEFALFVVIAFV